jgi:hypothetical protein
MPNKAKLVTREVSTSTVSVDSLASAQALSFAELDSNFLNLRDQTIGLKGSDSTVYDIKAGDTVTFTNATITSDSTGTFVETAGGAETVTALTSSAAIAVDCDLGTFFTVTLAHNATFTFSNFGVGQTATIKITQDGTGSRTGTFVRDDSGAILWLNGYKTLSTTADRVDLITFFNDGTHTMAAINNHYYA